MRTRTTVGAALVALGAVLAACGTSGAAVATGRTVPPPAGLPSFYSEPAALPHGPAGTVVKSATVAAPGVDGTVHRVLYLSETETGAPVAVTGLVFVPRRPPPPGGYPVVTWGHGTNGMTSACAPSLQPASAVPEVNALLDRGWEVTASDYQGEGTPGLMPYLAGVSAARNTVDIVRAARHLSWAHASATYVVWGHSEGGQTAMFALHIGAAYAPELHLAGVVAGAPPSQFELVYSFLKDSPYRYYLLMAAAGLHAAYGSTVAPLDQVLTPKGMSLLPLLSTTCADGLAALTDRYPTSEIAKADPATVPAWKALLDANDPGTFATAVAAPLLIIQGGADEQIPPVSTQLLASHLCGVGQDVERWIYPGRSHSGVIPVSTGDMVHWIADRFAGRPAPDPYVPTGQAGITTSTCPAGAVR